jgi:hypothetical protein
MNTFQSVDLDYRNRVKLTNLKQGSDSIDTYNKNFLRLSTQLPNLRLDDLLFATANDCLGCCTLSKHEIILDSRTPIYSHPYRKSIKERSILSDEVRKLLDANIIRPSRSPYASPVILVPKKDNTIRMCVDFRRLNKVTVSEQWPLPRIDDILDGLLRLVLNGFLR